MHSTRVVAVLTLVVGLAHCFPWDIVVGGDKQLHFYYNGTLTHTEEIALATRITSVTYDPVHYRVLFTDFNYPSMTIYSFDLLTRKIQSIFTETVKDYYVRVVYDPVTQLLVWKAMLNIYTFSLNPASSDKAVDGNLFVTTNNYCRDIAVDSCGGYIYWITDANIKRARLDGSEREVIVDSTVYYRLSLAIDQQTKRIYWIDSIYINGGWKISIESANFNGRNQTTIYIEEPTIFYASSLAISKDFIYWQNSNKEGTWQLPKNSTEHVARKLYSISSLSDWHYQLVATNYIIQEQIEGIQSCEALKGLMPNSSNPQISVSICQNYCLEGNCSVNGGGQPTCSCKAGYSGERCEVSACHDYCLHDGVCSLNEENKRVCQCTAGYDGERCDISICNEYCVQGNCSVGADGLPKCSCKTGYSGERCEINACHDYCLHGGVCSLNEENKRVCQCTAGYDGERCDISICNEYCVQGNCSVGADGLPKCSCTTGYSGERCEENACHKHCLNGGVCSLNEEDEPACQCTAGYDGRRCEVFANKENSCDADNSGEATVSACRRFCLNNGVCSLNEASEPVCQCTADYEGQRCDVPAFVVKWFLYAYKNVPPVALSEAVKSTRASTVV